MILLSSSRASVVGGFVNQPADPDLIPNGRRLLDYLYTLAGRPDKKVLSGQRYMAGVNLLQSQVGKFPAIYNDRMMDGEHATGPNSAGTLIDTGRRDSFLNWWNAGGICHEDIKCPHPRNFTGMQASSSTPLTASEMDQLVTENGNAINTNWRIILDRFTAAFLWLQDRGVPLIIRPFHEMNGVFWYRGHNCTGRIQAAWIYTFNYWRAAGVHNLLYCYSPAQYRNTNNDQTCNYPGNQYVDIISFDLYAALWSDTATQLTASNFVNYAGLLSVSGNKPFMLGEFGPRPADNDSGNAARRADYARLMPGIQNFAPRCCGVTAWNVGWALDASRNDGVATFMNHAMTANRDDVPNLRV